MSKHKRFSGTNKIETTYINNIYHDIKNFYTIYAAYKTSHFTYA